MSLAYIPGRPIPWIIVRAKNKERYRFKDGTWRRV